MDPIQRSLLVLDSSGGGGHKLVASKRESVEKKDDPTVAITRSDVLMDFVGQRIGKNSVESWDHAQQNKNITKQEQLVSLQPLANRVFFLPIFYGTLKTLFGMKSPDKVVITQVMGLNAIMRAISVYNFVQRSWNGNEAKEIKTVELWMTDFVSEKAVHFLNPLSTLTEDQKQLMHVFVPTTSSDNFGSLEEKLMFTDKTGFKGTNITFLKPSELPVADIYHSNELKDYAPGKKVTLSLKYTEKQKKAVQPFVKREMEKGKHEFLYDYPIEAEDHVRFVMLGSQPTKSTVKNLISKMIQDATQNPKKTFHFFAFCGKDETPKGMSQSFFEEVCHEFLKEHRIPQNLSIVPFPYQNPEDIAKIRARADERFLRGGGSTGFELVAMRENLGQADGKNFIVSEKDLTQQEQLIVASNTSTTRDKAEMKAIQKMLVAGIPVWEGGNTQRLLEKGKASVISIDTYDLFI